MSKDGQASLPKVMYSLKGIPMLQYSIDNVHASNIQDIIVVVGYKREMIKEHFKDQVEYAVQEQQLGTGHALMSAMHKIPPNLEAVLVCYGDMPLYTTQTINHLISEYHAHKPTIAMLSVNFENPTYWAYGRIVRDNHGNVNSIVEQKDCTSEQLKIKECNPGFYIFNHQWLRENISKLTPNNAQKEYYLTDLIALAVKQQRKVIAIPVSEESEALGINTPEQLKQAEEILDKRQ
jgi:bifunctional UDP-N-acetylglucosamine pyrophosphorylase/glucosamine-1-phosphate N-acetyltransferase